LQIIFESELRLKIAAGTAKLHYFYFQTDQTGMFNNIVFYGSDYSKCVRC